MALGATGNSPPRYEGSEMRPTCQSCKQDAAAGFVHGAGDQFPAFDLLGRPDAWRVGIADAHRRDAGGFGQHQAGAGALAIVFGHHGVGHAAGARAAARQRGQKDAVRQAPFADGQRIE